MPTTDLAPPRLAVGSHTYSRAYGCAMNVMSWENGDTTISDMPDCTAEPLARTIHLVNDSYCTHTEPSSQGGVFGGTVKLLCAPCSVNVLDLAHRTVGTTGTKEQTRRWGWLWAEQLLIGDHGVIRYVWRQDGRRYVHEAAAAMRRYADGETDGIDPKPGFQLNTGAATVTPEAQALRVASVAYQIVTEFAESGLERYVNPSLGAVYLGVRTGIGDPWFSRRSTYPSLLIEDAHLAVDAWHAVMKSEVGASESTEAANAPELVTA
jgi:hypothetical protein